MITLAEVDTVLRSAQPILAVTVYPVLALSAAVFGSEAHRLGADTQHDVSDYAPTLAPERRDWPLNGRRRLRRQVPSTTPIHDELAAEPMSDETAHRIARVWLEEFGRAARAKAGIYRSTADRDLTGAFPVVRAA